MLRVRLGVVQPKTAILWSSDHWDRRAPFAYRRVSPGVTAAGTPERLGYLADSKDTENRPLTELVASGDLGYPSGSARWTANDALPGSRLELHEPSPSFAPISEYEPRRLGDIAPIPHAVLTSRRHHAQYPTVAFIQWDDVVDFGLARHPVHHLSMRLSAPATLEAKLRIGPRRIRASDAERGAPLSGSRSRKADLCRRNHRSNSGLTNGSAARLSRWVPKIVGMSLADARVALRAAARYWGPPGQGASCPFSATSDRTAHTDRAH